MCDYNEDTIALKRSLKDKKSHFSEELLKLGDIYIISIREREPNKTLVKRMLGNQVDYN